MTINVVMSLHKNVLRNTLTDLRPPKFTTRTGQRSFSYKGTVTWNSLSTENKVNPSLQSHKRSLK